MVGQRAPIGFQGRAGQGLLATIDDLGSVAGRGWFDLMEPRFAKAAYTALPRGALHTPKFAKRRLTLQRQGDFRSAGAQQ
jgi:hypothetical protein